MIQFSDFLLRMNVSDRTREYVEENWKIYDLEHRVEICIRDNDDLLRRLSSTNLRSESPIINVDYIFWVRESFHTPFLEILAMIFSKGDYTYPDYFIQYGFGWQISSTSPNTIFCSENFRENIEDKKIFSIFNIHRVKYS